MNNVKILQLDAAIAAARIAPKEKGPFRAAIISSIEKLATSLDLQPGEELYCFASPHVAPKLGKHSPFRLPKGFHFVIPDPRTRYDKNSVKFAFWITKDGKITADAKCTTFFSLDGQAQIADDDWVSPEYFVKEMVAHLRKGAPVSFYLSAPRNHAMDILPLIRQMA